MSQRENLINLIVVRTPGTPEQLSGLRQQLAAKTTAELDKIADQQTLEHYRARAARQVATEQNPRLVEAEQQLRASTEKLVWSQIFSTVINGRVPVDNQAARQIIKSWLNLDEELSPVWFVQVLKDSSKLAESLTWQNADVMDPKRIKQAAIAQAEADRKIFEKVCRNHGLSTCEANFQVLHDLLQDDFSEYSAGQVIASQAVSLVPASSAEIQQRTQQAAKERQDYLINRATPEELRAAAHAETEHRRQEARRAEQERQIAERAKVDAAYGYPPLPEIHQPSGEPIDATWLNRISNTNLPLFKALLIKHGNFALTQRLRGIKA